MERLIDAQERYITFLELEIGKVYPLLSLHGYVCPQEIVDEGNRLREEIKIAEKK